MSFVFPSLFLCLFIVSIGKSTVGIPFASEGQFALLASEYRDEALAEINARRSAHCAAPLAFDSDLNKIAQSHATTMCRTRSFQSSNNRYRGRFLGENLYLFQSSAPIDDDSQSGNHRPNSSFTSRDDLSSRFGADRFLVQREEELPFRIAWLLVDYRRFHSIGLAVLETSRVRTLLHG